MTLTACKETLYLTLRLLSPCQGLGFLFCREAFLIVSKTLTDDTCLILSSFSLADLTDRTLNLSARLLNKALGFLLRFGDDTLTLLCNARHLLGVLARSLLEEFLFLADALALALPVALVAYDVLQVLVHVDVVCTDRLADFADDLLGQTNLAGDLNGEGATRATNREAEERAHLVAVIEHCPVDKASMLLGVSLEVLIVGGDDTEGASIIEAM